MLVKTHRIRMNEPVAVVQTHRLNKMIGNENPSQWSL